MEGLLMCVLPTLFCVFGKRRGAARASAGARHIAGLITPEHIRRKLRWFRGGGMVLCIACLLTMGMYDRIVIDVLWVGHTGGWLIPGTEDLRPCIPARVQLRK